MSDDPRLENSQSAAFGSRYLSFSLGKEEYAIPLLAVREVIAVPEVTPIPFTPAHFLGIMNLRGQVISIIDLRLKLGIKPIREGETSVIICDLGQMCLGVVVDSINSVLSPKETELSGKPDIESNKNTEYITGVYRKQDHLIIFLDIVKVLDAADHKSIGNPSQPRRAA
jgi:purine-binding chemotaxis protein CheW